MQACGPDWFPHPRPARGSPGTTPAGRGSARGCACWYAVCSCGPAAPPPGGGGTESRPYVSSAGLSGERGNPQEGAEPVTDGPTDGRPARARRSPVGAGNDRLPAAGPALLDDPVVERRPEQLAQRGPGGDGEQHGHRTQQRRDAALERRLPDSADDDVTISYSPRKMARPGSRPKDAGTTRTIAGAPRRIATSLPTSPSTMLAGPPVSAPAPGTSAIARARPTPAALSSPVGRTRSRRDRSVTAPATPTTKAPRTPTTTGPSVARRSRMAGDASGRSRAVVTLIVADSAAATPRMMPAVVSSTPNIRPAPVTE